MRYRPLIFCLLACACQPQPQALTEPAKPARQPARMIGLAPVESLAPDVLATLQAHDLSPLLQTVQSTNGSAQNGFFGPDHYRIEMAFTEVRRDPVHPTHYFLQGKDRYKGRVTPFAGTFIMRRFSAQPADTAQHDALQQQRVVYCSAEGRFELREDAARQHAGLFQGQLNIDFVATSAGSLFLNTEAGKLPSKGGNITYAGTWTDNKTHRTQPVVWVEDIIGYGNQHKMLADFGFVERHPYFNPKYARLGWNNYWSNEEWWVDSKQPAKAAGATSAGPASDTTHLGA